MDSKLLGFDLSLRMNIIEKLDEVWITRSGKICEALKIDEPDFNSELDRET